MTFSVEESIELLSRVHNMGREKASAVVNELGPMPFGDGNIGTGEYRYQWVVEAYRRSKDLAA